MDGTTHTDQNAIAELFNNYFINVSSNLSIIIIINQLINYISSVTKTIFKIYYQFITLKIF